MTLNYRPAGSEPRLTLTVQVINAICTNTQPFEVHVHSLEDATCVTSKKLCHLIGQTWSSLNELMSRDDMFMNAFYVSPCMVRILILYNKNDQCSRTMVFRNA